MGKKTLGVTSTRRPKRAGNVRWLSATNGQARLLTRDVEVHDCFSLGWGYPEDQRPFIWSPSHLSSGSTSLFPNCHTRIVCPYTGLRPRLPMDLHSDMPLHMGSPPISDNARGYIASTSGQCLQPCHQTPWVSFLASRESGPRAIDIPLGSSWPPECLNVAPPPAPPVAFVARRPQAHL